MQRAPLHSLERTDVTEWIDGVPHRVPDSLAAEEPLEIRVAAAPWTVTMRTPGHDLELATGLLLSEGLIDSTADIASITAADASRSNRIDITLNSPPTAPDEPRTLIAASGCGVCGKATIDSLRRRGLHRLDDPITVVPAILTQLPAKLRTAQNIFDRTGGLHAAALFTAAGDLLVLREDIGRHNAVDKVIGWAAREGRLPLTGCVLLVSGRGGFEIIQKAISARVPVLASVSAPSTLAVRLAREMNLTLIGFLRGERFIVYSADQRILPAPAELSHDSNATDSIQPSAA